MPGKGRSKEDTWKESDLKKAIQSDKKERSSRREDDRRERRSDRDDDRRRRERREDVVNGEDKDREHRRKERSSDKERTRDRDRDGERTREKSDRDKERRREREGESSGIERRERERSERDKESSRDRERHRDRDSKSNGKDRRERDKRERDHGESEGRRKDRESDKDRERHHRSRREHEGDDRKDERKSKERDDGTGSDERRKDKERRRRRDEGESSRHHDENRDKKRERSRDRDHRDRRKEREHEESRRQTDKSGERREKRRERDDRERRKENEEEVVSKRGPSRGERFRADTLEEADVVDEEDIKQRKSSIIKTEEVNAEDEYNYEEDFEDYEDDFENEQDDEDDTDLSLGDRNAGMQELLNAINLENETVTREGTKTSRSSDDDSRKEPEVKPVSAKGRINFVAAKQKQISEKVASRTRKRGQELMHLIDLDVVVFEMFDLPPMNEYELYIKNFGRSDTKQAYVQCNDDNLEKEIQTEEIETRTMWTQNPAEDFAGCGDERGSQDDTSNLSHATVDSVRLARFLQTAGQACLVLLEEESADQSNKIVKDKKEMTCSDGYIPLATKQPYLAGRTLECLHVSPVQNQLLLTAYGPVTDQETASHKTSDSMKAKSIICLWNVNEPSTPQKILICESVPRCCCLSPSKATIAFAGLEDGSVVAWDLRESPSIHHSFDIDNVQVIFRAPTFSTASSQIVLCVITQQEYRKSAIQLLIILTLPAGVLSHDNHHSPVVSLLPVVMPGDSAKASTTLAGNLHSDDMLGLSFQLASLEENAVINIWVVVELGIADIAGSESDLGLAPGGKIKLIKSSSLPLEAAVRDVRKNAALQTYTMRFLPQDPNHFYIGTDSGYVLHRVRHGGRAPPKTFGPQIECLAGVTTLDVSPWQLPCFLAGNRDGSIRLYNINNELPLNTWTYSTQGSSILSVQWSNSIPSVFFVLDANSTLYIWDLLKNDSEPVAIEKVKQGSVISFELSSDYSATGVGVPGRNAELLLGYTNGSVEVHQISERFSKASPDELDRFHEYLEGAL